MNNINPLFTVVTVCRNEENTIEDTIVSIINQEYSNFEYIIIDGASTDKTVEVIDSYRKPIKEKNIPFVFISERDNGIYDAMNKAIKIANGTWTIFINAGDELYDKSVLKSISKYALTNKQSVIYGDVVFKDKNHYKHMKARDLLTFDYQNPIYHQGSFTKTKELKTYLFDLKYKLVADYDLFLRMHIDGKVFLKVDEVISIFDMGGVSSSNLRKCCVEMNNSRSEHNYKSKYVPLVMVIESEILSLARMLAIEVLGSKFYSPKRGWKNSI